MRVLLLNDGGFSDAENVTFPVEVEALRRTDAGIFKIHKDELHRVGFVDFNSRDEWPFHDGDEAERLPDTTWHFTTGDKDILNSETSERRYCISVRDKCCNQFGERDEIQTIINSLQADVVARGNRITELERALQGERRKSEQLYNLALDLGACSEFMKAHFACEWVGDVDD